MQPGILFEKNDAATPIHLVTQDEWQEWLDGRDAAHRKWLETAIAKPKSGAHALLPASDGSIAGVVAIVANERPFEVMRALAEGLPAGDYRLAEAPSVEMQVQAAWYWAQGHYSFKVGEAAGDNERAQLVLEPAARAAEVDCKAQYLTRDLINRPAMDLGPEELLGAARELAKSYGATVRDVRGEELAREYPMVAAVGRGADREPILIEMTWGDAGARKLNVVGKGVVFDSGGLDIKPANYMRNMKKDMGGGAHALGLAQMVMGHGLPVRLRVLIPAVENAVSGDSYRPGDILRSRKGLSVEIHNTDAEGRLVLADALADAAADEPEVLIDFATLTGAARVALGPELPALFSTDDELAEGLLQAGRELGDEMWRMPLHDDYRRMLDSSVADISNAAGIPHAGAITAALFLKEFAGEGRWAHLDIYGWNDSKKPGRAAGAEAMTLRAAFRYLADRFGS
jgi:leucyl aminopeptidase